MRDVLKLNILIDDIREYYHHKRMLDYEYHDLRSSAVDFFRGITVVMAIMYMAVALDTNVSKALVISEWNGMSLADLITPFFILVMGTSIPFYVKKLMSDFDPAVELLKKASIKFLIYFLIGLLYSALFMDKGNIRLTGPIQMIAIAYIFSFLIYLGLVNMRLRSKAMIIILISVGLVLNIVFNVIAFNNGFGIEKNTFVMMDKSLIGSFMSSTKADPEGILVCINSISLGILGLVVGVILNKKSSQKKYRRIRRNLQFRGENKNFSTFIHDVGQWLSPRSISSILSNYNRFNLILKRIVDMLLLGVLFLCAGLIVKNFIPLNRNVLSISFVLISVGTYYLVMDLLYIICDVIELRYFVTLISRMGKNSLFIIVFTTIVLQLMNLIKIKSIYTSTYLPLNEWFTIDFILPFTGTDYASLAYSVVVTVMVILFSNILERYDIKFNL